MENLGINLKMNKSVHSSLKFFYEVHSLKCLQTIKSIWYIAGVGLKQKLVEMISIFHSKIPSFVPEITHQNLKLQVSDTSSPEFLIIV